MKPYSLTRRLITTVLLIELVSALAVAGVALLYEKHAHFRAFDVLLHGRADSILGAVQDAEDANDNVMLDGTELSAPRDDIYEVIDSSGRILGKSTNWDGITGFQGEKAHKQAEDPDQGSFSKLMIQGRPFRIIRLNGSRIVDPGDKGGGIRRYVTVYYGSSVNRVWGAVYRVVAFYAFSSMMVLASTGFLMAWLLNRGLLPLRELALAAQQVTATSWSFSPPEQARSMRELKPLVAALESALEGLQRSFEQQKRFVGDAAHELKTSVAVVKSSMQLLGLKQRTAEEYQIGLDRCLKDCARMEAIVAQMLTLARIDEKVPNPAASFQSDPAKILRQTIEELEPIAERRGIALALHVDTEGKVDMMQEDLKLVCTNLLLNAIQHSPSNSFVTARVGLDKGLSLVQVIDRGDGIAAKDLPHIFERFYRSDQSRSRETGGTGLGLAISKAAIERAHGTIQIESEVGAGTRVIVRVPQAL